MVKGVGHLAHVWSYCARDVVSSIPDRGNIVLVGWVFHPTRWLVRFSLIWTCLSFQILNLFRTLSSRGSGNYRPSAPLLYEVARHVKQLPFRPLLLNYYYYFINCFRRLYWMCWGRVTAHAWRSVRSEASSTSCPYSSRWRVVSPTLPSHPGIKVGNTPLGGGMTMWVIVEKCIFI